MSVIELRSDTFTQPTPGMRQAIANAICGDDMLGEDPTVNELEARICQMLGKEAAVFACSGTQSNQMGVWAQCRTGDELLIEEGGHIANYEGGAPAVLGGVSCRKIRGTRGMLSAEVLQAAWRPINQHFTPTRLVCVENTANLGGGVAYPLKQLQEIREWATSHGLSVHMDGARFFNACIAGGYSPAEVAATCDTISICFSKGLGCPMGSILVGSKEVIFHARRARKIFGGALRQAGIVAAACVYALDNHLDRLKLDHDNAQFFAREISTIPGVIIDPAAIETNLVYFEIDPSVATADQVAQAMARHKAMIIPLGPQRLRACTHLDVNRDALQRAADILREVMTTRKFTAESTAPASAYSSR
ncbi:MAG: GntG family PLP-dependent aldolase [Planctomycetaceae bacterium]